MKHLNSHIINRLIDKSLYTYQFDINSQISRSIRVLMIHTLKQLFNIIIKNDVHSQLDERLKDQLKNGY